MKTLFLKSNILYIRTNEGEFEVSNPEVIPSKMKNYADAPEGLFSPVEWTGGVELIEIHDEGRDMSGPPYPIVDFKTVARLIPEEKKEGESSGPCAYEEECQHPACNCGTSILPFKKECPKCRTKDFASCHSMYCPVRKPVSAPSESQEDIVKQIASIAWKGAANAYRMYPDNKHTFASYWAAAKDQFKEFFTRKPE